MGAEASSERPSLLADARRSVRLIQPGVQLRLAIWVLAISLAFFLFFAWHGYYAYSDLHAVVMASASSSYEVQFQEQTRTFLMVSTSIVLGYVFVMLSVCIAYTHRLLGAVVPLRRQVQALKNGNYRMRVQLRKSDDAFLGLADELNELTQLLGSRRRGELPPGT